MALTDTRFQQRNLQSIGLYLGVAFAMAWSLWLLVWLTTNSRLSLPIFPVLVAGSFGPLVGALVTTLVEGGPRRARQFFARAFDWRMGWAVFLVSVFLLPVLALTVQLAHARLAHESPHFNMTLAELPLAYLFLFVLGGTLAEEYGWSLLSDRLDNILPLRAATLVLGFIWAVWHLPLFFIIAPGLVQGYTPFQIFLIATVPTRFLFAWAYHRGGCNILSNMLFHTSLNLALNLAALAPAPDDLSTGRFWMFTGLIIIAALIFWNVAPPVPDASPGHHWHAPTPAGEGAQE